MKLLVCAIVVAAATGYLAYLGAASSWQYYLSVDETVDDEADLLGKRIRVSGRVVAGSLNIRDDRREAEFDLAGPLHTLHASCRGAIPDNLAEGIDVVVEGRLHDDGIHGHKVVTRCASKYQPEGTTAARSGAPHSSRIR